jgi:hypothetical protein
VRKPVGRRVRINKEQHKQPEKQPIIDTTLIIGLLTVAGYYVSFSYEKGYKSYFHLNEIFLSNITLVDVLISIAAISSIWMSFYPIVQFLFEKEENVLFDYFFKKILFIPTVLFLLVMNFFPKDKYSLTFALVVAGIVLFIFLIPPLLRKEKEYLNKVRAYQIEKSNKKDEELSFTEKMIYLMENNKMAVLIMTIIAIFVSGTLAGSLGRANASKETNYMIIKEPSPYVVIDQNGGNLIIAPIDLKAKTITPKYQIIESKSDMKNPLIIESMKFKGGLDVKDPKKIKD